MSSKKSNPIVYEINRVPVPDDIPRVHTDASYKNGIGSYAFMVRSAEGIYIESDTVPEEWLSETSRSCELFGTIRALDYCRGRAYKQVGLFFDYVGIYTQLVHRPGDPEIFKKYADVMSFTTREIDVFFHKVEGEDDYHDLVDILSRANVRLSLGGEELGKYRQLIQKGHPVKTR